MNTDTEQCHRPQPAHTPTGLGSGGAEAQTGREEAPITMGTHPMPSKTTKKRKKASDPNPNPTKRSKSVAKVTNTNTVPIHRGKFKSRFLQKHAFLTRRADPPVGWLVSCASAAETRALGQIRKFMDVKIVELFPQVMPVWTEVEAPREVDMKYVVDDEGRPVTVPKEEEQEEQDGQGGERAQADQAAENEGSEGPNSEPVNNELSGTGALAGVGEAKQRQALFQMYDSGCAGLLFMRFRNSVPPQECVLRLFDHIVNSPDKSKMQSTDLSFCHRFLPIEHVCSAATEHDIVTSFGPLLKDLDTRGVSVAIVFESRNAPAITRKSFIPKLAAELPPTMKVDLVNPEVVVLVTVFKSVAGMTVVKGEEYRRNKRFNVQQL